ncbi:hypothetical protein GWI33_012400 [Rhynchophorus ferrugineus]|uniref:Uncharacterized protein n=1 Tax=Rhynchophorus ferrugineus TaxID=354439 RepID=A0A834I5H7_RHYFE|nr:hypothetical protein GWI33_012400 [Rhynchophorus ferrugineus]
MYCHITVDAVSAPIHLLSKTTYAFASIWPEKDRLMIWQIPYRQPTSARKPSSRSPGFLHLSDIRSPGWRHAQPNRTTTGTHIGTRRVPVDLVPLGHDARPFPFTKLMSIFHECASGHCSIRAGTHEWVVCHRTPVFRLGPTPIRRPIAVSVPRRPPPLIPRALSSRSYE